MDIKTRWASCLMTPRTKVYFVKSLGITIWTNFHCLTTNDFINNFVTRTWNSSICLAFELTNVRGFKIYMIQGMFRIKDNIWKLENFFSGKRVNDLVQLCEALMLFEINSWHLNITFAAFDFYSSARVS